MGILSREDVAIAKKEVKDSKSVVSAPRNIHFAHQFVGGETTLNLLALTTPTDMLANGFVNATPTEIASANLSIYHKNLKLSLSRGLELKPFIHYMIVGNSVVFIGALRESGGALADEQIFGEVATISHNAFIVGDVRWERGTVEVLPGQTTVNIGYRYRVNANPLEQVGDLKIKRNGVTIYRNVGNATASPSADGNFQEIGVGGFGTTIELNEAPVGQSDIIEYEVGLKIASGDLTIFDSIERMQGQILAMAQDLAPAAHEDNNISRYLSVSPTELERKAFGDLVLQLKADLTGSGTIRKVDFAERKDNAAFSTSNAILSGGLPTITNGDLIFDVNFIPRKVGNRLLVEVQVIGVETSNSGDEFNAALFVNNGNNAVGAGSASQVQTPGAVNSNNQEGTVRFLTEVQATGNMNFKVRAACNGGSAWLLNAHQNFSGTAYSLGGTMSSYIKITEIEA